MNFRSKENLRACENIREEYLPYVLSQYAASPHILELIKGFKAAFSNEGDIEFFYQNIFNIDTASGVGLDVWGAIVDAPRNITDPKTGTSVYLEDTAYRFFIRYKAAANIAAADSKSLNNILNQLFPEAPAYVLDFCDMSIRYVIERALTADEQLIFNAAGTFCRGAGVGAALYAIEPGATFGFAGSGLQPFSQGTFDPYGTINAE